MNERLPVAMISLSYGVIRPSSVKTTLANRSIRVTRTPACRVMSFSTYQSHGVEEDVGVGLLAGQHVAEHDPVVVAVRLVAEHGDRRTARRRRGRGSPRPCGRRPCRCRSRPGGAARPASRGSPSRGGSLDGAPSSELHQAEVDDDGAGAARRRGEVQLDRPCRRRCPRRPAAGRARRPWRRSGSTASARRRASARR